MGNINFQVVMTTLKEGVIVLASTTVQNYANEAKADGLKLLDSLKTDIEAWKQNLVAGKMSAADVEFLIMAKKELIEMNALKQAGMGRIKVDEFKNSLLQLVVKTIISL
jgi:flagellar biosynthesis/type III secretory pathway chaperone